MSREIKFRAWCYKNGRYRDISVYAMRTNKITVLRPIESFKEGEFVLEQFTGLKDDNGKEIYEGDIVDEHSGDIVGKIVYSSSGEWRIEWIGIFGGSSSLYGHLHLCRVIGNIHENPELLEGEK